MLALDIDGFRDDLVAWVDASKGIHFPCSLTPVVEAIRVKMKLRN